jgi:DNA polymerase (family X)
MGYRLNEDIAGRLEEVGRILRDQGADRFRVLAYRRAAAVVRQLDRPIDELFREGGAEALEALPRIGPRIARAIRDLLIHGRLPMLDRLRGDTDPLHVLASVSGIGWKLAERLHDELGIETLEQLETAAHDGRLEEIAGFGEKRLAGIRDSLAHRLARIHGGPPVAVSSVPIAELLDVDREYRARAAAGDLKRIAPRRFNPSGEAWLPVLHTRRGARHYTALFSNTARAHRLNTTGDWVVLYHDADHGEGRHTVITAARGALRGRRVVAGRDAECLEHYRAPGAAAVPASPHAA